MQITSMYVARMEVCSYMHFIIHRYWYTRLCVNLLISAVVTICDNDGDIELSTFPYDHDATDFVYSIIARVDYCYNRTLRGICDAGWSEEDAVVACRRYGDRLCKPCEIFTIWGVVNYGTVHVLHSSK